jgi:hypothetical protein
MRECKRLRVGRGRKVDAARACAKPRVLQGFLRASSSRDALIDAAKVRTTPEVTAFSSARGAEAR